MVKVHMQQLEKKGDAANLDKIKKALEEWNPEGWKGVFDQIRTCRLEKCFDSKIKKLVICISKVENKEFQVLQPYEMMAMIVQSILAENPRHKELAGISPAGDLARRIQELLDQ